MQPLVLPVNETTRIAQQIAARRGSSRRPFCVALDGRSGAGKSTLALRLAGALGAALLDGDSFFAGGTQVREDSPEARARGCIDWRKQRPVLESLRGSRAARYQAFDWEAFDGTLEASPTVVEPAPSSIVILEGVYSARPELADLLDLRFVLRVADDVRLARLEAREQGISPWERQWHEAEEWYFTHLAPPSGFDVIVEG